MAVLDAVVGVDFVLGGVHVEYSVVGEGTEGDLGLETEGQRGVFVEGVDC